MSCTVREISGSSPQDNGKQIQRRADLLTAAVCTIACLDIERDVIKQNASTQVRSSASKDEGNSPCIGNMYTALAGSGIGETRRTEPNMLTTKNTQTNLEPGEVSTNSMKRVRTCPRRPESNLFRCRGRRLPGV